jgi:hypothetical protein
MVGALQCYDPVGLVLIGREELLPKNESGSGTEASIVTVATLSHDSFEAPCQNQNNLECPQLTDTIHGSNNEISHSVSQENAAPQSIELSRSISVPLTDDDLSNDAAVPPSTVPPHNVLPDPDRPQGYPISSPQSVSGVNTRVWFYMEPTNGRPGAPCHVRSSMFCGC